MLNGTNFKIWKENVMIVLGVMDLDLAFRIELPNEVTDSTSTEEKREMKK